MALFYFLDFDFMDGVRINRCFEINGQSEGCGIGDRISLSGYYAKFILPGLATMNIEDEATVNEKENPLRLISWNLESLNRLGLLSI